MGSVASISGTRCRRPRDPTDIFHKSHALGLKERLVFFCVLFLRSANPNPTNMSSFTAVSSEYLSDLLSDKTTVAKMPKIFIHAERLLDQGTVGAAEQLTSNLM